MASDMQPSLSLGGLIEKATSHLSGVDDRLRIIIGKIGMISLKLNNDIFFSLVESILSQQLTPKAADSIIRRLVALFPDGSVTPDAMLGLSDDALRSCGISRQKISYIKNIAEGVLEGSISSEHFNRMSDEEIISTLVRIKGIGTWTAKMFLIFSLGRTDVLPHEDLGIINAMQRVYLLEEKPSRDIVEKIAEKWHPYCSIASLYLWKLKDDLPWENEY